MNSVLMAKQREENYLLGIGTFYNKDTLHCIDISVHIRSHFNKTYKHSLHLSLIWFVISSCDILTAKTVRRTFCFFLWLDLFDTGFMRLSWASLVMGRGVFYGFTFMMTRPERVNPRQKSKRNFEVENPRWYPCQLACNPRDGATWRSR